MKPERRVLVVLGAVLGGAFLLRLLLAVWMPNQIWPDEIYQSLEQAHRTVFGYGVQPWEFRSGSRSWILPGLLAGVMAACSVVTSSATAYLTACAGTLCALSLAPLWATFRTSLRAYGLRGAVVATLFLALWFETVYFAPKALTEVIGGHCLVAGTLLADDIARRTRGGEAVVMRTVAAAVALVTLGAIFRIQVALASLAAFVWMLVPLTRHHRVRALGVAVLVVLAAGLVDLITWGYPFHSYIENIRVNIVVGRSLNYGIAPWYAYFDVYASIWGWSGLVVLALAALGSARRPLLLLAAIAVLLAHIPVAHKEYRFAFPAMLFVITLAGLGAADLAQRVASRRGTRMANVVAVGLVALWMSFSLRNASGFHENHTRLAVTFGEPQWHWVMDRGGLLAMREVSTYDDLCGIALFGVNVYSTGGYAWLHRDVPLFEVLTPDDVTRLVPHANVYFIIRNAGAPPRFMDYEQQGCIAELCVYKRPGTCTEIPGYHFNKVLQTRND